MFDYLKRFHYFNGPAGTAEEVDTSGDSEPFYSEKELEDMKLSSDLAVNMDTVRKIMQNACDLVVRDIRLGQTASRAAALLYINDLIDSQRIDSDIIRPLIIDAPASGPVSGDAILNRLNSGDLVTRGQVLPCADMKTLMKGLLTGYACLLVAGTGASYLFGAKGNETRSITEPNIEPVIRGPKDSFVESLGVNIALVRTRLASPNLSFESVEIGTESHTKVCISYLRGVCPPSRVAEVRARLHRISIDGILESGYLEEFIQDSPFSIFPQVRNTERPDTVAAGLLEGRVAILTDNTPIALIVPGEFFSLLQAAEDYYDRFVFSTFIRIFRFFALLFAAFLPAFYIAVTCYHRELIPTDLLISIAQSRVGVPISSVIEAVAMNFALELLYEAGVRLPKSLGQTISIVGALIIGQAAVQAKLVSPLTVIVISLTGIATFCIPQYNLVLPLRIIRFIFMVLAASFGLFGMMVGMLYLLLYLSSLRSFGVAYLAPIAPFNPDANKDMTIRAPWWVLVKRPSYISANSNRMRAGQKPHPPGGGT